MHEMTSRERVLRTLRFQETDRAPFDLMESVVWSELQQWCSTQLGLTDKDSVLDHFGVDFRWFWPNPQPPAGVNIFDPKYLMLGSASYSDHIVERPLANVTSVDEMLSKHVWMEPEWWDIAPAHAMRAQHPDKAIVMLFHTTMLFMSASDFFGIEETLLRLLSEDEVMIEFLRRQSDFAISAFRHACSKAQGAVDICWMMDDIATQRGLMMRPDLWRRHFKEHLRSQVKVIHEYGMYALFHSCGSIRDILPDLIEIGIDAVLPFQTNADGMSPESIAQEFGGQIAFYGGMDVQHLLTFGSEEEVRQQVRRNLDCFRHTGGYIVSNSHHCIENINPRNVCVMLEEARKPYPMGR